MTKLQNFPIKNQLADTNEVNKGFDCVPTSLAACLQWLLNKPFDGADIKDAVYGKSYQGGTAAIKYVDYCKAQGVNLFALNGDPAQLVQDIRSQLQKGIPLIGTEPDPYANPSLGWSHVVAFFGCDEPVGTLTCLDPYGGHVVTLSNAEWEHRLMFQQVWALERIEEVVTIDISQPEVAHFFKALNDHQWQCIQTGKVIQYGVLSAYKKYGNAGLCGLTDPGLPISNEVTVDATKYPGVVIQFFERGHFVYDVHHVLDNPPGAGEVYKAHLYSGPGRDPELLAKIKDLQAQLTQAQAQLAQPQQAKQHYLDGLDKAIADLQAARDQAKQ